MIPPSEFIAPFPARSITLAAPLRFPRDAFEEALAKHARLLDKHGERLLSLTRELATSYTPPIPIVDLTAVIVARRGEEDEVSVKRRGDAAFYVSKYRGVSRLLLLRPDAPRLHVVVAARGAISLHVARMEMANNGNPARQHRTLVAEPRALVVEPIDQQHRTSGLGPLPVTRWTLPGRRGSVYMGARPARTSEPGPAGDRVLGQYPALVQERLQTFLSKSGRGHHPLVLLMSIPDCGHGIDVVFGTAAAARDCRMIPQHRPHPARGGG